MSFEEDQQLWDKPKGKQPTDLGNLLWSTLLICSFILLCFATVKLQEIEKKTVTGNTNTCAEQLIKLDPASVTIATLVLSAGEIGNKWYPTPCISLEKQSQTTYLLVISC